MIKLYVADTNGRNEHELGALLAHRAIADAFGCDSKLQKDLRGKPYFEAEGVFVSISHSRGRCVAAVSDGEIGVDIEYADTDKKRLCDIAVRYFAPDEAEYVKKCPEERFYEIWCAKESYIKYTGEGFSRALPSFSVLENELCFTHFKLDGYEICVCSCERAEAVPILLEL